MLEINKIHQGDCLELMKQIEDKSVDMILCDLPYGTTACKWDTIIPFKPLWEQYERIIKDKGVIVITASQPFTSKLIMSNIKMFKYCLIWNKKMSSNFLLSGFQPLKIHEEIAIFSKSGCTYNKKGNMNYNAQLSIDKPYTRISSEVNFKDSLRGKNNFTVKTHINNKTRQPTSIIEFTPERGLHPTQKPVSLFKYLIKTYSQEGDIVLDNTAGSGTTAVACKQTKRHYICIEINPKYVEIAQKRLSQSVLFPLDTKQEGGNGIPPTNKLVGILPKIL